MFIDSVFCREININFSKYQLGYVGTKLQLHNTVETKQDGIWNCNRMRWHSRAEGNAVKYDIQQGQQKYQVSSVESALVIVAWTSSRQSNAI